MRAPMFPWGVLMGVGIGVLGIPPADFWRMTPRELMAAAQGAGLLREQRLPPDRAALTAMMQLYPDDRGPENDRRE